MRPLRSVFFLFLCAVAIAQAPLSQRVVHYEIDAKYDAVHHTVAGHEVLTYTNLTGQPQQTFPFHLYLNAFDPKSTWIREARRSSREFEWKPENKGGIEIKSLTVTGMDAPKTRFISPDDGNPDDKTVMQVELPRPVAPGAQVQFVFDFQDKMPEVVARTGYKGDFVLGGQWFPKVGVWWHGAWNCHQFHANTEFFADFGTYDVKLTVPQNQVVGATGVQTAEAKNNDGTKTLTFHQDDVHDFAWTADPEFKVVSDTYHGAMGPVAIRILMLPEHMEFAPRFLASLKATMQKFEEWYGPYPYKTITVVDPATPRAGGMEYPTFITADTLFLSAPNGLKFIEIVVIHEYGHQYWYGMVATNEFEDAWLDEGINAYSETKVADALYGRDASFLNTRMGKFGEHEYMRAEYIPADDVDPIAQPAYSYLYGGSYGGVTYGKTATALLTLEGIIGEDTLRRALHTYFMRYRFTHPTKEDFLKTIEEVSGQDLRWYFDQAIYGTPVLDYEVWRAGSYPEDWYYGPFASKGNDTTFHTNVVLHRKGDFIFPEDVLIKFSDGSEQREHWDGKARWIRYEYDKRAQVKSVEIDPEHKVWLDVDFFNNSWRARPDRRASNKLASYWTWCTQFIAQALAWLA
jgi:peptidase M1-like protein